MQLWELDQQIKAVCPIAGVSIGLRSDKSTWRIDFDPSATQPQKDAATALMNGFDFAAPSNPDTLGGEDYDTGDKALKALALVLRGYCNALQAGTYTQKTVLQLKTDFITAWKALP